MTFSNKELIAEFKKIRSVDLSYKAVNLLEKTFWAIFGIAGALWAVYFITLLVGINYKKVFTTFSIY